MWSYRVVGLASGASFFLSYLKGEKLDRGVPIPLSRRWLRNPLGLLGTALPRMLRQYSTT